MALRFGGVMVANRCKGFGEMQFHDHGLVISGTDFFDLMTQQMQDVHRPVSSKFAIAYGESLQNLLDSAGKDKAAVVHEIDDAVGGLVAETEIQSYKNGFADAICMILQAAMRRD